jgi:hypothetical protein
MLAEGHCPAAARPELTLPLRCSSSPTYFSSS